ncbi:hypothetical protein AGMMS49938_12110 [Fibrobacterales bacterium]|nr:hypothetical protein AGMMS49938_12110 [Fibrobacterales bacterium]
MRSLFSVLFFAVSSFAGLSVQSLESSLQSQNLSIPRIQFINNSQENINGFTAYYYFTSTEPNPVFESYDLRGGNGSVEHLGGVNYRVKYNYCF